MKDTIKIADSAILLTSSNIRVDFTSSPITHASINTNLVVLMNTFLKFTVHPNHSLLERNPSEFKYIITLTSLSQQKYGTNVRGRDSLMGQIAFGTPSVPNKII